jgi:hypothetical protein
MVKPKPKNEVSPWFGDTSFIGNAAGAVGSFFTGGSGGGSAWSRPSTRAGGPTWEQARGVAPAAAPPARAAGMAAPVSRTRQAASQRPGTAGSAGVSYGGGASSRASTAPLATGSTRLAKVSMRMPLGAPSDRLGSALSKGASSVSAKRSVDRSTGPSDAITAGTKAADPHNWVGIARSLGNKGNPNYSQWKNKTATIQSKGSGGQFGMGARQRNS